MKTKTQIELEKQILRQMNIDSDKTLEEWMRNPYLMNSSYNLRFWDYIKNSDNIFIVGDYDVDGVCATYIMTKGIKSVYPNKKLFLRLPKRMSEGYGFNQNIIEEIKEKMPNGGTVITVDNGIAAASYLEELKKLGYTVLLTDHHELGSNKIPDVDMVLDPKVPLPSKDIIFNGDYWCGAAVAYKLIETMVSKETADELSVFAGIATVGDCMPLTAGNWALVKKTLEAIRNQTAPKTILDLCEALKRNPENVTEEDLGFYLCPAINACGRLLDDGAKKSLLYFLKPTPERCQELVSYNDNRKDLKEKQLSLVCETIVKENLQNDCPIWVYVPGLHEGLVGILAGQVAEQYNVPAIVLTDSEKDGVIKGSARSAGDINIFEYLNQTPDKFIGFGGHAGAAGLSLYKENLYDLRKNQLRKPILTAFSNNILMDITQNEIPGIAVINDIYRPFGEGNPSPYFSMGINLKNEDYRMLGAPPVHLCINDPLKKYKIMHFYHEPNELKHSDTFKITGKIKNDTFRGKTTAVLTAEIVEDFEVDDKER